MRTISQNIKFKNHTKNAVKSEISAKFKIIIETIVQKVKIAKNDFDEKNIEFKKYCHKDVFFFALKIKLFTYLIFCLIYQKINLKVLSSLNV